MEGDHGGEAPDGGDRDELARAMRLIDGVLQAEGVSPEQVDARLGRPAGTTAAVLQGRGAAAAARRQVLEILAALELAPEVFFRALYPETSEPSAPGPRAPLFERLGAALALAGYAPHPADDPADDGAVPDPEELERRVREAIRAALAGEADGPDDPRG
jgi:hypothetical protein